MKHLIYLLLAASLCCCKKTEVKPSPHPVGPPPVTVGVVDTSRMSWWEKARFGMFIHFGVYSVPGGVYQGQDVSVPGTPFYGSAEWIMHNLKIPVGSYKDLAKSFNPTEYDPEQWVLMAKEAGMKYIVITTKHHDGFAMFDTKYSDWNVVKATPYGKDMIRPLADACRKYGMKIGFYYSQALDWVNKGSTYDGPWDAAQIGNMDDYIDKVAIPQIREILTNYGDVAELWWDNQGNDMNPARAAKFLPLLGLQQKMITNNRLGGDVPGDFDTPEQSITGSDRPWESCMTMNETWGFSQNDNNWKSSTTLIRNLIEASSLGGNYLLNVGPEASGKFPQPIVDRLKAIGKWMKVNSEAIYETTAGPFSDPTRALPWGRATAKVAENGNTTLYLHVYDWPANQQLLVPGLSNDVLSATLLANGSVLKTINQSDGVVISVPQLPVDEAATVIKLQIKGTPQLEAYIQPGEANGSIILSPGSAQMSCMVGGNFIQVESANGEQNLGSWTEPQAGASWQFMIPKAGTYTVKTSVATEGGSSTILLVTSYGMIKKQLPNTGGYFNYQEIVLGQLTFDKPGLTGVTLAAEPAGWTPVNMRKITLTP